MRKLFQVNNKDTRTIPIDVTLVLVVNRFHTLFGCFHCRIWTRKWCRLGHFNRQHIQQISLEFLSLTVQPSNSLYFFITDCGLLMTQNIPVLKIFPVTGVPVVKCIYSFQSWKRYINPLSANPTNWSNTLKQFVGNLPTNCLRVFGNFVILALKGLSCVFKLMYIDSLCQ